MAPRLSVLAGPSLEELVPISVNDFQPHRISSDVFEGEVVAHIKNFTDEHGRVLESEYFDRDDRQGVTWSIQVQGRFLVPYTADDILFGNTFDRPLKLPWGTSAVLRFMNYIDPTLEHDLQSHTKPWALSPLISTMPYFSHTHLSSSSNSSSSRTNSPSTSSLPPFPTEHSLIDNTSELHLSRTSSSSSSSSSSSERRSPFSSPASSSASSLSSATSFRSQHCSGSTKSGSLRLKEAVKKVAVPKRRKSKERNPREFSELHLVNAAQRRSYFSAPEKRRTIEFGPMDVITTDFCYGFINFNPTLSLQLPGGLSFDLMRYWDGQPVRFVCCERKESEISRGEEGKGDDPWGRIFWCVAIEIIDDEEERS